MGPSDLDPLSGLSDQKATFDPVITPMGPSRSEEISFHGDTGVGTGKYDEGLQPQELGDLNVIRAQNQSTGAKLFNGIVGGVASGLLTAVEDLGYLADVSNNVQRIAEMEEVTGNWLTKLAKAGKAGIEKIAPIYRRNPDKVFDWEDPGFYFTSLKGILDSAVGFAIPGMAVSKGIGAAQKALRLSKYTEMLTLSNRGQQMVNAGLSGAITNFAEGKMMAIEQFENSMTAMEDDLFNKNYEKMVTDNPEVNPDLLYRMAKEGTEKQLKDGKREEFTSLAGNEAETFIKRNRMFAITDAIGLHGIYKGKGAIRNLLKPKGLKAGAKRFTTLSSSNVLLQAGKEGAEEIGQNILQLEGEYQAATRAGMESEAPEDFAQRIYDFGTSEKALLEGMMGLLGGGPQRILTEGVSGNLSMSARRRYKAEYQKQQAQVKANAAYTKTNLADFARGQTLREESLRRGEDNLNDYIKASQFQQLVSRNLDLGTIETLERNLQDIAKMTPEQAAKQGFEATYQEQAKEQLKVLAEMESEYSKLSRFENQKDVFDNRMTRDLLHTERQRYEKLIEEADMELETDPKNPQLLRAKEVYTNGLEVVSGHITELDKLFRHKTSNAFQKNERKKKKIQEDQARKNAEAAENVRKEDNKKAKAKARQDRNSKKQAEKAKEKDTEETKEEGPQATQAQEEETKETGPSEEFANDPTGDTTQGAKETIAEDQDTAEVKTKAKESFKKSSGELFDTLESEAENQQSPAQRMVGLLETMINDYKASVDRDEVDFAEIIEALIEEHGVGRVEGLFGRLEAVYKLTNKKYESVNYLSEFRKLTPNDEKEVETAKKRAEEADKGQFVKETETANEQENDELEKAIGSKNNPGDDIDYRKVVSGAGILAYLARKFEQLTSGRRKDVDNRINEEILDKSILDRTKYGPGTKLTLRVDKGYTGDVYVPGSKTPTKWQAKVDRWADRVKAGLMTQEEAQREYEEQVPIAIYAGETKIAYLHETTWINESNVSGNVEQDQERSRNIRRHIIATGGEYNTTVTKKSTGYLWRSNEGQHTLDEAMPDDTLPMVIGSQGELKSDRNTVHATEGMYNERAPREGVAHVIVPIGEGSIAIPLNQKLIGNQNGIANTITTAMEIFLYNKKDHPLYQLALDEAKVNITTNEGIKAFIKMYVNNYNMGLRVNLKDFLVEVHNNESGGDNIFMNVQQKEDGDAFFQIARGDGVGYYYLSKKHIETIGDESAARYLQEFKKKLAGMYTHANLANLNSDENVVIYSEEGEPRVISYNQYVRENTTTPFLAQNIGTEEEPNWTYTLQPVIEMDFSQIDGVGQAKEEKVQVKDETKPAPKKKAAPKKKSNVKVIPMKPLKRGNGKINEDDLESLSEAGITDENQLFLTLLAEYSDENVTAERKAELDTIIASMYYAEGEMVSFEEKRRKTRLKRDELESLSATPLTESQLENMKKLAEARLEDNKLKGVIISDLGATRQQQIVSFLRGRIVDVLFKGGKSGKIYAELRADFQKDVKASNANVEAATKNLEAATAAGDKEVMAQAESNIQKYTKHAEKLNRILDNWTRLVAITDQEIQRIDSVKKTVTDEGDETRDETEQKNENEGWIDRQYENDPSDGLATAIKQFLSGVREYTVNKDGSIEIATTYWGDEKYMSYQDLYNTLQKLTPNLRPNFEEMMVKLEEIAKDEKKLAVYPFMKELVTKLRSADEQIKNQFVNGMTNHDVDMRFIMFSRDEKGNSKLVQFQSNANSKATVIQAEWYAALLAGGRTRQAEGGEIIIPKDERDFLVGKYKEWAAIEDGNYNYSEMRQWLADLGVTMSDQSWEDLKNGQVKHLGKTPSFLNHVKHAGGLFKVLADNIASREDDSSLTSGDKLLDEGVIKSLARHEADYAIYSFGNSHRTGNRTVYSYGQNKYMINRMRDLKDFKNGKNPLIEDLASLSFSMGSEWLQELVKNGGDNAFTTNFNRWLFSLEPLKKKGARNKDNAELQTLSDRDIEIAKIGMLQATQRDLAGGKNRIINILYPTTSDKTTVMGIRTVAANLELDVDGNITETSIQSLFDRIVRPEIRRIKSVQDQMKKDGINLKGYEEGGQQFFFFPEMNKVEGLFNEDGSLSEDAENGETLVPLMKAKINEYFTSLVDEKLAMWQENGIVGGKEEFLNSDFMNIKVASDKGTITKKNPLSIVNDESKVKGAAADMVFQYLIGNAEIAMTFTGDPALYYKQAEVNRDMAKTDDNYNFVADAEETYINIGKRLAADIAPGYELADAYDDDYVQGFVADRKSRSLNALNITKLLDSSKDADFVEGEIKKLEDKENKYNEKDFVKNISHLKSAPYYAIEAADAQEYTTWREHLHVMYKSGELSKEDYDTAYKVLESSKPLEKKLLGKVMQPMKPVFVDNIVDKAMNVERRVYIKSSAFPLLPQLTQDNDLDNLRKAMEGKKKGQDAIKRVAFGTAVKVGNVRKPATIFGEDGKILPADQIDFTDATMTLNRRGFRIQQRVPYDPDKSEINKLTQAAKNLFINMLNVKGFQFQGGTYTGAQLQAKYHAKYDELHRIERDKLLNEVTETKDGIPVIKDGIPVVNKYKLRQTLLDEARNRNYPISDQELLHIDQELSMLAFSPSADKYESLLNSIVTNRVIRLKMPGKSFVLGSEEGFNTTPMTKEELAERMENGVVYTSAWTGELLPMRPGVDKNGNAIMLPAQALVPWKLRNDDGQIIDIKKYIITGKDGLPMIDPDKVPNDVLRLFGMRIPNQGPNSQSMIEIAGFLPEAQGDLIIATKDYVVQMGSDFDVDKLYTYMYNTRVNSAGNIRKVTSIRTPDAKSKVLQNDIIDVHMAIHENMSEEVQKQIVAPLGFWKLDTLAEELVDLRKKRTQTEEAESPTGKRKMFTGLSDGYQRNKFKNATAGKDGVASFSVDSMFNAVAQGKGLVYTIPNPNGEGRIPLQVRFGKVETTNGNLSNEYAIDGTTYRSDIIAGYQSAAVDNEKEQILDKLNINTHTFKVIKLLNQLGFGEEVVLFTSQDIIIDYVKELERLSSVVGSYVPNRAEQAMNNVLAMEKYALTKEEVKSLRDKDFAGTEASAAKMREFIELGSKASDYRASQVAMLKKFMELNEYGKEIQTIQSTINPDSRGIGKSVIESILKEEQVFRLGSSPVANATKLVGTILDDIEPDTAPMLHEQGFVTRSRNGVMYAIKPETINGQSIVYGLFTNNDLWANLFHYHKSGVDGLLQQMEYLVGGDVGMAKKADNRHDRWNALKSFIFSDDNLELHDTSIGEERIRLLTDTWKEKEIVDGEQIITTTEKDKDSLAAFVQKIRRTKLGSNNPFIASLETNVRKGDPSTVEYRASAAEKPNEVNMYIGILQLLQSDKVLADDNGVPIKWNGEEYTGKMLMQDLILYSYVTGGVQEAIQFIKYIPASYLKSIPFAAKIAEMTYHESNFGVVDKMSMPERNYVYAVPPFIEQFFQHRPESVPQLTSDDLHTVDTSNWKTANSFMIKSEARIRTGKSILDEGVRYVTPAPYVTLRSGNANSNLKLYKYNLDTETYVQIDTLGTLGVSEYNRNTTTSQPSLIPRNKANTTKAERPKASTPLTVPGGKIQATPTKPNAEEGELEVDTFVYDVLTSKSVKAQGVEKAKSILESIVVESDTPYFVALAEELGKHIDQLPTDIAFASSKQANPPAAGKYHYGKKLVTLFSKAFVGEGHHKENVARVTLHEMAHALTGYKVLYFEQVENNGPYKDDIDNFVKTIPGWSFTEKDRAAVKSIRVLMKQAEQKILKDPALREKFNKMPKSKLTTEFISEAKTLPGQSQLGVVYGFKDTFEFISEALTNPVFQAELNKMTAPSGKTFWATLKERLTKLFDSMFGFQIEKGSVLEAAIYDIFDLMTTREDQKVTTTKKPNLPNGFEVIASLSKFEAEDFMPESMFPTSPEVANAKFRYYLEVKETELASLRNKLQGRIALRKKTKGVAERRTVSNSIRKLEEDIKEAKKAIDTLVNETRLNKIGAYAEEDMNTLEAIFNKPKDQRSGEDIETAKRLIHIWQQAGDFSGDVPHIFFSPEELEEQDEILKEEKDNFLKWRRQADGYNVKLIKYQKEFLESMIRGTEGFEDVGAIDFDKPISDTNFLVKNLLDVSEIDNIIFQAVARWVKDANFAAKEDLRNDHAELDKLIEATGLKEFGIFQQTFGNNDTRLTGDMVDKFSQSYYDWNSRVNREKKNAIERADSVENDSRRNALGEAARRDYIEEMRRNTVLFDPRIFFHDERLTTAPAPTDAQKQALESRLRDLLGDKRYEQQYKIAEENVETFKEDLEDYKDHLLGVAEHLTSHHADLIDHWVADRSPYVFGDLMQQGYDGVTYAGNKAGASSQYVQTVPKNTDDNGSDLGYYDNKFQQIEQDDNLLNLYNFMFKTLQNMKDFLPGEDISYMRTNSIPTIRKKTLDAITSDGTYKGFSKILTERISESVRADDIGEQGLIEERKDLQINMLINNKTRINDYIQIQDTAYRADNEGSAPTTDMRNEWKKDIMDQIAQEKSFDLGRVMKAFSAMATAYKHKAAIEDQIRTAQDIIGRAVETRENFAGDPKRDKYKNLLSKKGLGDLNDMMENFLDVAYWGYAANKPEGRIDQKKHLNKTEKALAATLKDSQSKLDQLLADEKIDQAEYEIRSEVIKEQLEVLGGIRAYSKYGDILLKYVQYKGMGWNVYAAFSNMGFGLISNVIEASDGRNYSMKSYRKAQAMTFNSVLKNNTFNLVETGTAHKIRALMNRLDVLKESRNEIYKSSEDKLFGKFGERFDWMNPFNPQSRSEYFNQAPVMIAMMMDTYVTNDKGEKVSMWDKFNEQGEFKEGEEVSLEVLSKLKAEIDKVVKMNHGNYDPDTPIAAKRKFIGRAASQFRTWAFQGFAERFRTEFDDHNLTNKITGENYLTRKGRYRSYAAYYNTFDELGFIKLPANIVVELLRKLVGKKTRFEDISSDSEAFTEVDAANMRKNLTEIVIALMLTALTALMKVSLDDDDDKARSKKLALNLLINQIGRLATDITFYTSPMEFERLSRNALPIFSLVIDGAKVGKDITRLAFGGEDILQSGPDKGKSRTLRDFAKLVPGPVQYKKIQSAAYQVYKKN